MGLYVGIDVGTSATKVLISDEHGSILGTSRISYDCKYPQNGWSEQDPDLWYNAAVQGVKNALHSSQINANDIVGISFGGQMHGLVLLDKFDRVIRPAILWNDGRSERESNKLNETVGRNKLTQLCGNISFPGFTASKVLWVRNHEPKLFARVAKIMLPKDYLVYKMTGSFVTDVSDASGTLFFNVAQRAWSKEMLEILNISSDQLPTVHESWDVVGSLTPSAASDFGLNEKVNVIVGAGDNAASAIGMGVIQQGDCNISLGTSGTVFLPTSSIMTDANNSLHAFADASGKWHVLGCVLSAASANLWWISRILNSDFKSELGRISTKQLGYNSVFFLPYLMGERSPINNAAARATFIGMSAESSRIDMAQAVLEGVAFALRQCVDAAAAMGIDIRRITLCGGGAKNPIWRKIIASVLNRPIYLQTHEEGPAFGACILAMVGNGLFPTVQDAVSVLVPSPVKIVEPLSEAAEAYTNRYEIYCRIYPLLSEIFRELPIPSASSDVN